jgi:glycosyltransferase involved in cell wall biosynthesis
MRPRAVTGNGECVSAAGECWILSERMRVGVDGRSLVDANGRGVAQYTRGLLSALAQVHPDDEWHVLIPEGTRTAMPAGVRVFRVPLPSRVFYGLAAVFRYPRLDEVLGGVDVFWAPAPAPLALSRDVPLLLTLHDLSWELRPHDFTRYERFWHQVSRPRALAASATRIAADSGQTRAQAIERWGLDPGRVAVVPPVIRPPERRLDKRQGEAIRGRFSLPSRYFLSVGALEPRKAPEVLARAFHRARAAGLDADLAIVGQGRLGEGLSGPGLHLLGRVTDVELDGLYAGALALVMPSRLEGFGLPPLEAALRGTPSIVSDLPVFAETLGDGAVRVPVEDEARLAVVMRELAGDEQLRARLRALALAAVERFTSEDSAALMHTMLAAAAQER